MKPCFLRAVRKPREESREGPVRRINEKTSIDCTNSISRAAGSAVSARDARVLSYCERERERERELGLSGERTLVVTSQIAI